jgi:threonine dehydrogenase-like Zn-dependent dehydrogenase
VKASAGGADIPLGFPACPEPVRLTLLAALCWVRQTEITDGLVELLTGLIQRINARAERRVEKELIGELTQVPGKKGIFLRMVNAALDKPNETVREALWPVVPGREATPPYRGVETVDGPSPMGHEYVGVVEEVGDQVTTTAPGQFVIGSFFASDNTCEICPTGYQSSCIHRELIGPNGAQAEYLRVPLADGTLVATPSMPDPDLVPSLLTASDVLGTGWFGAVAAEVGPGKTVVVVGDGAVGLLAVLAAKQLGAERIIAMSRHESRAATGRRVRRDRHRHRARRRRRGPDQGAHRRPRRALSDRSRRHPGVDDAGIRSTRPGGHVGYVGVAHSVELPGAELFFSHVHLHGGPAPVHRFLPELIDLIWNRTINPGKVFDLELLLEQAAEGYKAMDERRAIKALLAPVNPSAASRRGHRSRAGHADQYPSHQRAIVHDSSPPGDAPRHRNQLRNRLRPPMAARTR